MCVVVGDCSTDGCIGGRCRVGPTAGLTLSPSTGVAPVLVTATSTATAGDAAITTVEYDFGLGYAAATSRNFTTAGTYVVRQRVTDANGLVDSTMQSVVVTDPAVYDCRLSLTDRTPEPDLKLTADRLAVKYETTGNAGARSACSVAQGSGVWYFEASVEPWDCDRADAPEACATAHPGLMHLGVGVATSSLTMNPGSRADGIDINTGGTLFQNGMFLGNFNVARNTTWGYVIDYRGTNPIVHILGKNAAGADVILVTRTLTTTSPVFAMVTGAKRAVAPQAKFNFGNDTNNHPFVLNADAILRANTLAGTADALVLGLGGTNARPLSARPTLTVSGDVSIALGATVMLTGTAVDAEDGDLTSTILWEDVATTYGERDTGVGGSFSYRPRTIGLHPIRATVVDSVGRRRQRVVHVNVTGTLPLPTPVQLVNDPAQDPLVGGGIVTSPDLLSARWVAPDKMGIRANTGLYGAFWYYEFTRQGAPVNQGGGVSIWEGDLNPYAHVNVPPSLSINTGGTRWHDYLYRGNFTSTNATYGFAVDYRATNPTVYYIIGGVVVDEWDMFDVFVPLYPLLYGNPTGHGIPYDTTANFGATPFVQDPCAALAAYGVSAADRAAFRVGWGVHATGTCP